MPPVHVGLISKDSRGVLLAGPGGSGKSTSAITSACAGFSYLSDDLIGLELSSDDGFVGHSLYNSPFVEPDYLKRFPLLNRHGKIGRYPFEKKHLVLLLQILSLRFARTCRIHAVVLPRVMHLPATQLRPATKVETLLTLAPSSLFMGERNNGLEGFNMLMKLAEQLPCYWLELGRDLNEVPNRVEELINFPRLLRSS